MTGRGAHAQAAGVRARAESDAGVPQGVSPEGVSWLFESTAGALVRGKNQIKSHTKSKSDARLQYIYLHMSE